MSIFTKVKRQLSPSDSDASTDSKSLLDRDVVRSAPFWLPPFLLMGLFVYGAILWNFVISLTNTKGIVSYDDFDFENYFLAFEGGTPEWSRFDLTVDPIWNSMENTVVLMIVFSVVCLALGLLLAILVDQKIRYENTFRTIYLLPFSLSFVVTAKFWAFMYNKDSGLVNSILELFGAGPVGIVQNGATVFGLGPFDISVKLTAVIVALIWQFSGYAMVVYLAGLRAIPSSHFEAARVDGASSVKMYIRVIIPQLRTATVSALVVLMVFALKAFDFLFALYSGYNPGPSADILATRMVREAYAAGNLGYASAIAIVLFVMSLLIVAPYLYSQYRRGEL